MSSPGAPGSPIEEMTKKCPMCAERIKLEALVCRYCGHLFDQEAVSREVQTVEAELAKLPGAPPRWCLVVDQVPPERRAALLGILREVEPSGTVQETGPSLDGRGVTIARGLAQAQANSLLARLLAAGVPARKIPENSAPRTLPPAPGPSQPDASRPRPRRAQPPARDAIVAAVMGTLLLVLLVVGYLDLTRFRSPTAVPVRTPAGVAGGPVGGGTQAEPSAGPASTAVSPPAPSDARGDTDRPDHVFFFSRGDQLVTMSGEPLGTVERLERTYTFPDGTVGAAYAVRTPAATVAVFHASQLERAARLQ
jgi:Uncharacterised protein family UPF0547